MLRGWFLKGLSLAVASGMQSPQRRKLIPCGYYIPREDVLVERASADLIRPLNKSLYSGRMRLIRRRESPDDDGDTSGGKTWKREPMRWVPLLPSLASPHFLQKHFHVLTSVTEIPGGSAGAPARQILSRCYYAPVLCGEYDDTWHPNGTPVMKNLTFNVFSIRMEPSDRPADASTGLLHRPQCVVDVGTSSLRLWDSEMISSIQRNLRPEYYAAFQRFRITNWPLLVTGRESFATRQPSTYAAYRHLLPEGELAYEGPRPPISVFHRYDPADETYMFCYETGASQRPRHRMTIGRVFMFLDPGYHFKAERLLWDAYVGLWRAEMGAQYGGRARSRLVHPREYFEECPERAEEFTEMVPRHGDVLQERV